MEFQGHLLYIDITQICGIGCTFCMYADKHKTGINMELSTLARKNLATLINAPSVKRISISGEGEPLNNVKVFHEILSLSDGGKCFEIITSGFLPHAKMADFYDQTDRIVTANGDTCNIRLSADSHHIEKVKWHAHGFSLDYLQRRQPSGLSFSFRSIDTDKNFTRQYLVQEMQRWDIKADITELGLLEDVLVVGEQRFGIDYKNLVNPDKSIAQGCLDMHGYIAAIEAKVNKYFTFGSLNQSPQNNGMDVTIKPNGDVYLYGIEIQCLGNIHFDQLDWQCLQAQLLRNPLALALYTEPLTDLLLRLENSDLVHSIIHQVNNPYWLVKELAKYDGILQAWEVA